MTVYCITYMLGGREVRKTRCAVSAYEGEVAEKNSIRKPNGFVPSETNMVVSVPPCVNGCSCR